MTGTSLDVIIVPTMRSAPGAADFAALVADALRVRLIVIPDKTIAAARNEGLQIARAAGWETVMFLDDDIRIIHTQIKRAAARLALPGVQAVAFRATSFPDNSVVRHAARLAGAVVPVRLGGGAMLVNVARLNPERVFLDVYNEDWLFMHGLRVIDAGEVSQLPYDPFVPGRAASQELGDLVGEAVRGRPVRSLTAPDFWAEAIAARRALLRDLIDRLPEGSPAGDCVREAREALRQIPPDHVGKLLSDWRAVS